jgi:hypothetical protein
MLENAEEWVPGTCSGILLRNGCDYGLYAAFLSQCSFLYGWVTKLSVILFLSGA